jgi:multidrug resistance efflux pump
MTQQIEVEPTEIRAPVRNPRRADPSKSENAPHSAKRVITTFIVALVFACAVIVGLIYMVNSAAYQSTDDAFIEGHIVPVSAQVAGRVQSVYVDDNQNANKGDLIVELDPRDFDAAARQKAAALASSQAQAARRKPQFNRRLLTSKRRKQPLSRTRQLPSRMPLRMIKLRATSNASKNSSRQRWSRHRMSISSVPQQNPLRRH